VGLGPLSIHFYALCILLGIIVAMWIGQKRYVSRGGIPTEIYDVAIYAIPAGIIGGRIYHVVTTPELYFGADGNLANAFRLWNGGMGIWGAVLLGTLATYLYFKKAKRSRSFAIFADCLAPGILCAQAIGRFGNWFNGELFGRPTTLPWALSIPSRDRPIGYQGYPTFQPTFAYEAIWCIFIAILITFLPAMKKLTPGNVFLSYIAGYCVGRIWIEALRIDDAHHLWGVRLNDWVAGLVLALSLLAIGLRERRERARKISALDTIS